MPDRIAELERQLALAIQFYQGNRGTPLEQRAYAQVVAIEAQLEHLREGMTA